MSNTPVRRAQSVRSARSVQSGTTCDNDFTHDIKNRTPWSQSPFEQLTVNTKKYAQIPAKPWLGMARPANIEWMDLILDVAVTTVIANLTDGTQVLGATSAASYVCLFWFTWWIWASQVLYNAQFRQEDWFHRICAALQLLVFCALAAFTSSFDLTNGILSNPDEATIFALESTHDDPDEDPFAETQRANYLAKVNGRGLSIMFAISRLLLLVQYVSVWFHARGRKDAPHSLINMQCMSLFASTVAYLAAFIVLLADNAGASYGNSVAKVVLWCLPVLWELSTHYVMISRREHPDWEVLDKEALYSRARTLFAIMLGAGLDKITKGFRFIAGNVRVGAQGVGLILSAIVIFVTQITLYYKHHKRLMRADVPVRWLLVWFYANFLVVASLILTLQGTSALLELGNLSNALELPLQIYRQIGQAVVDGPGTTLVAAEFDDLRRPMEKLGINLTTAINHLNGLSSTIADNSTNDMSPRYAQTLQTSVNCLYVLLEAFDQSPEYGTVLHSQLERFIEDDPTNTTRAAYVAILEEVHKQYGQPALWFFGAAGMSILMAAVTMILLRFPLRRDKQNSLQVSSLSGQYVGTLVALRILFGIGVIFLLALDIEQSAVTFDHEFNFTGPLTWDLAVRGWVLPTYAIVIGVEQVLELVVVFILRHVYRQGVERAAYP